MINLNAAGLSATEAKCYTALLERPEWTPADLAKYVNETRTNCYKILDKLTSLGLAEKFEKQKKYHYRANNPSRLLELSIELKNKRNIEEKALEAEVRGLIDDYIRINERPDVRYYQGERELKLIYMDQIETKEPIYIIRPDYNMDLYDFKYMSEIRHLARKAGIKRYAITPDRPKAPLNYKRSDPFMLLTRTWLPAKEYTSPVEWNAYGDKLAIMSYGTEATGVIIHSPQIAEAFRQLYKIMEQGIRRDPEYNKLPVKASYIGSTK